MLDGLAVGRCKASGDHRISVGPNPAHTSTVLLTTTVPSRHVSSSPSEPFLQRVIHLQPSRALLRAAAQNVLIPVRLDQEQSCPSHTASILLLYSQRSASGLCGTFVLQAPRRAKSKCARRRETEDGTSSAGLRGTYPLTTEAQCCSSVSEDGEIVDTQRVRGLLRRHRRRVRICHERGLRLERTCRIRCRQRILRCRIESPMGSEVLPIKNAKTR